MDHQSQNQQRQDSHKNIIPNTVLNRQQQQQQQHHQQQQQKPQYYEYDDEDDMISDLENNE